MINKIKKSAMDSYIYFASYSTENEIQRYKKLFAECCVLSENKYLKFKKILQENIEADRDQVIRSIIILINEVFRLLLEKNLEFNLCMAKAREAVRSGVGLEILNAG